MALTVTLGQTVTLTIDGHSAVNGAMIPSGSTIAIVSNDPSVATANDIPPLTADTQTIVDPVTLLAAGSTDFSVTVTTPTGDVFTATDSLIVNPVAVPGLTHITATLAVAP
jgi:hypothetical protein